MESTVSLNTHLYTSLALSFSDMTIPISLAPWLGICDGACGCWFLLYGFRHTGWRLRKEDGYPD